MKKGDQFSYSFSISEEIYNGFIHLFKDNNPVHVNDAYAINMGFKSKVMHGNILGGFISCFIGEYLPIKNVIIHTQEIKYLKPVYLLDKLLFTAKVTDVFESVHAVEFVFLFENQEKEKVAKGKIQIGIK